MLEFKIVHTRPAQDRKKCNIHLCVCSNHIFLYNTAALLPGTLRIHQDIQQAHDGSKKSVHKFILHRHRSHLDSQMCIRNPKIATDGTLLPA